MQEQMIEGTVETNRGFITFSEKYEVGKLKDDYITSFEEQARSNLGATVVKCIEVKLMQVDEDFNVLTDEKGEFRWSTVYFNPPSNAFIE